MRFWWWLLLLPTAALAKTESWPRLYNNGVTAYKSNDFAQAAALFENATASQDRALQQRALYNLGNTSYRLGEAQPSQAQQLWQRAIKSYETALALDPKDTDAKFNHDFVKKKLEELKQQQQQQQQDQKNQQDKKQDQKKDDQQQQQQQKSEDKQSEQQQQQQSKPQQSQEQQKQEQQQQKEEQQQQQQTKQEKQPQPEQPPPENGDEPEKNHDKVQATALLDDLRENERNWNFFPEVQMKDLKDSGPPAKDW
jgi:Ca-activated chloride channel family protein